MSDGPADKLLAPSAARRRTLPDNRPPNKAGTPSVRRVRGEARNARFPQSLACMVWEWERPEWPEPVEDIGGAMGLRNAHMGQERHSARQGQYTDNREADT